MHNCQCNKMPTFKNSEKARFFLARCFAVSIATEKLFT